MSLTNYPNGIQSFLVENNAVEKTTNYSVVNATDTGKTFYSSVDGIVFTLPAIGSGYVFTFVNTAADGTAKFSISPNSSDGIMYAGSLTDDKDLINTKLTQKLGDKVVISNVASTAYWSVTRANGVWEKE